MTRHPNCQRSHERKGRRLARAAQLTARIQDLERRRKLFLASTQSPEYEDTEDTIRYRTALVGFVGLAAMIAARTPIPPRLFQRIVRDAEVALGSEGMSSAELVRWREVTRLSEAG